MARPKVALLDKAKISAAALDLVDRDGDFTMPALAKRLGVGVASLYHHVPGGRSDVVELVRVRATGRVDASAFDELPWDEAVPVFARSYLDAFRAHPVAIRLLATEPVRDPVILAVYRKAASGLRRAGFADGEVIGLITAVESFVLGAALDSRAPDVMIAADGVDVGPDLRVVLDAAPRGVARAEQAFGLGVELLVDGLRARLARRGPAMR